MCFGSDGSFHIIFSILFFFKISLYLGYIKNNTININNPMALVETSNNVRNGKGT